MADRTLQILPGGQSPAPFVYKIPPSTSFTLLGVEASFDGSAAGSAWLPCVQLVSDAGVVMSYALGESVAAGDSASVSFAPFLRGQSVATGGGIQFDVSNVGGFLAIETTAAGGFFFVADTGGFDFHSLTTGNVNMVTDGGDARVAALNTATLESTDGPTLVSCRNGEIIVRSRNGQTTVRGDTLVLHGDNGSFLENLPALDPGVSNQLWNDGGHVAISP